MALCLHTLPNLKFSIFIRRKLLQTENDEVIEGLIKLHREGLHNLHFSLTIIRMIKSRIMRWEGRVAGILEKKNTHRILVGQPEGKRPLGRPRHR
jgi:hypothetical protein